MRIKYVRNGFIQAMTVSVVIEFPTWRRAGRGTTGTPSISFAAPTAERERIDRRWHTNTGGFGCWVSSPIDNFVLFNYSGSRQTFTGKHRNPNYNKPTAGGSPATSILPRPSSYPVWLSNEMRG